MVNPIEQHRSRFIVLILRNKLTSKRLGKDGLRQFIDVRSGFLIPSFDFVSEREEGFDSADDFIKFKSCNYAHSQFGVLRDKRCGLDLFEIARTGKPRLL